MHAETSLACDPSSVRTGRQFVSVQLSHWGYDGATFTACLLVSELITNAVLHARTDVRLVLDEDSDVVRIAVHDSSARPVRRRRHSVQSGTGRGLRLVEQMSRAWGVDASPPGKVVWFDLGREGEPEPEPDLDAFLSVEDSLDL